jgi:hypothetical protein
VYHNVVMVLREIMSANSLLAGTTNSAVRWICQPKFLLAVRHLHKINVCIEDRLDICVVYVFTFGCYEWFVSTRSRAFSKERTEVKYITRD